MNENFVRIWEETCTIPTYHLGKPEKNPDFSSPSVYTGRGYPYPVIDKIPDCKNDIPYQALFLENAYLKIMVLPELGVRLQMVYDKVRGQHLVAHHQVIRPVWTGDAGMQLAGGIAFNWSLHRRSYPQAPADYVLEEHPDGSKTLWLYLLDAHAPVRGRLGFRLCMDKAYLEVRVNLYNHTSFPQYSVWRAETVVLRQHTWQTVYPSDIHMVSATRQAGRPVSTCLYPFEEQNFTQYWMSCAGANTVCQSTRDALVGWTLQESKAHICAYVSSTYRKAVARLWYEDKLIWKETLYLSPEHPFRKELCLPEGHLPKQYRFTLEASNGKILVTCLGEQTICPPASETDTPLLPPSEIHSLEQLYLSGVQAEQQTQVTYQATEYYLEALRREPDDIRSNNALGIWYVRRGRPDKARPYFQTAIQALHSRSLCFWAGESYYYMGWMYWMQGQLDEATQAFCQSSGHSPWQAASFLNLARLAAVREDYDDALYLVGQALLYQPHHTVARHLKTILLRKCYRLEEAQVFSQESLVLNPFNYGCVFERWLIHKQQHQYADATMVYCDLQQQMCQPAETYLSVVVDYMRAGLYQEAQDFLAVCKDATQQASPLVGYYRGFCADKCQAPREAMAFATQAMDLSPDFCFPAQYEDMVVLQEALRRNPDDARAAYYLGNFWYAHQQYAEAMQCWESARQLDDTFPTVHRNLALAYARQNHTLTHALIHLEKAFVLDPTDAYVLMELDQLYRRLNTSHLYRLTLLEKHLPLTESRDDLYLERMSLYGLLGNYAKVRELLMARRFYTGKESKTHILAQYRTCHIELAKMALLDGNPIEALTLLEQAEQGRTDQPDECRVLQTDMLYLKGWACQLMASPFQAEAYFQMATLLPHDWKEIYSHPENSFYQGMAWKMLHLPAKATLLFQQLIDFGRMGLQDVTQLPIAADTPSTARLFDKKPAIRNRIHWYYILALGYLGLGNSYKIMAEEYFVRVLELDNSHLGAILFRRMLHGQTSLLQHFTPSEQGWPK